ncbi:MAG: erg26, C-3 sterol dehydrogenase [Bogoriella megaspora]|nr:MAG: erg26, C-3 sterol dehydrogenase [Bogoriella megaspora]
MSQPQLVGHVLVTGGCGFLGSHIVELLSSQPNVSKISVLDLSTTKNRIDKVEYHDGDITNADSVKSLFEKTKPDVIIHTASPIFNANKPELMYKVNVDGTKALIKASQETGVKAFVYTSSASVISDTKADVIYADERYSICSGPSQPEYYTTTKALAESHVLSSNRTPSNFYACALRPAGLFGPRDVQLLPPMLAVLKSGRTNFQLGPNDNLFDFTYVVNAAHAHVLAATALLATPRGSNSMIPLDTERVDGEAFFITNDEPIYFWDFARTVWKYGVQMMNPKPPTPPDLENKRPWEIGGELALTLGSILEWVYWALGRKPSLTRQQARYSCMARYHSVDKARRRLGYKPLVGLEEGIRRGVEDLVGKDKLQAAGLGEKTGL